MDHSGDLGLSAEGSTLPKAFENAAGGLYALTAVAVPKSPSGVRTFRMTADSPEELLVNFLNRLIYLFDAKQFLGGRTAVKIKRAKNGRLSLAASVKGERYDGDKHGRGFLLKAATWHGLKVARSDRGWELEVVFDI